jgi:hypothetical protein
MWLPRHKFHQEPQQVSRQCGEAPTQAARRAWPKDGELGRRDAGRHELRQHSTFSGAKTEKSRPEGRLFLDRRSGLADQNRMIAPV